MGVKKVEVLMKQDWNTFEAFEAKGKNKFDILFSQLFMYLKFSIIKSWKFSCERSKYQSTF
jgi:hypothetical protein